jgi:hypothetical protein
MRFAARKSPIYMSKRLFKDLRDGAIYMVQADTITVRYLLFAVLSRFVFIVLGTSNLGQPVIYPVNEVSKTLFLGPSLI